MSTKAIVGITLCIIGIILSATFFGLPFAPIFFIPGIPLAHIGFRKFKAQHNRPSALLVVTLTLSYIASVCAVAVLVTAWGVVHYTAERKHTPQATFDESDNSRTPHILAEAYRAKSSPLSTGDTEILLRFGGYGTDWNRASAPLIRDYLDPKITGEEWVEHSSMALAELRTVMLRVRTDYQLLTDSGTKETVKPIVETQGRMLGLYQQLQTAIAAGDVDKEKATMAELKEAGLRKQELAFPIIQRLRSQMDSGHFDKRLQEMITEIGAVTTPTQTPPK